jgi:hypothetical protein
MAFQDSAFLVLDGLSIFNDPRPNPAQPPIPSGMHLQWAVGRDRGFPPHGFHLFRRAYLDTTERCLAAALKGMPVGPVGSTQLTTAYGKVSGTSLQLTDDFDPRGTPEISLALDGLGIDLPQAASRVTLKVGFRQWTAGETTSMVDFRPLAAGEGPNPRIEQGVQFQVGKPGALPPLTHILASPRGSGLGCNPQLEIRLTDPAIQFTMLISRRTQDPPIIVRAWEQDGTVNMDGHTITAAYEEKSWQGQAMTRVLLEAPGEMSLLHGLKIVRRAGPPEIRIFAMRGTEQVATATVRGAPGQIVSAELKAEGITSVMIGAGPAALIDLCYQSIFTGKPAAGPWAAIAGFPYPLTLPITHPAYPASAGPETLNAVRTAAAQRVKYGAAVDAFPAPAPAPGTGKVTLIPGSALAKGDGTSWDESLVGRIFYPAAADTAFTVMTVLAPDRLVLSRPYTGIQPLQKVAYQIAPQDVFAELHDRLGALLSEPAGMRKASMPPVLEISTAARSAQLQANSVTAKGQGTAWTTDLEGLLLEITDPPAVYRINAVKASTQEITLNVPFAGASGKYPYRILSRSPNNRLEEGSSIQFRPMDLVELAAFSPAHWQALGLYWIDTSAETGRTYDYILLADHGGLFPTGESALAWLNGTPDFNGDVVDGSLLNIMHSGSGALAAPAALQAFALPAGRFRSRPDRPDLADSEAALSIRDLETWKSRPPAQQPLMLEVWRFNHGPTAPPPGSPPAPQAYTSLGERFLPAKRTTPADAPRPLGWPDPAEVHYLDGGSEGMDVGWYSYRIVAIDAYGRYSTHSASIPWYPVGGGAQIHPYAVHLEDRTPPPPPMDVMAWILEPDTVKDPMRVADAAYTAWRAQPGIGPGTMGLRVRWRWPWAHELRAPDLAEFRVYAQSTPLNARFHRVVSVAPAPGDATRSLVKLAAADNLANDAYAGATLQVNERGYPVEGSRGGTNLELRVKNGGPTGAEAPPAGKDATIVLPSAQALHRDVLDSRNWERWFGAVAKTPTNAAVRFDIDAFEDPDVVLYDDPANPLHGNAATWSPSKVLLPGVVLTSVRPGIDVIALASDTTFAVLDIASVGQNQVVPAPPAPSSLTPGTYRWTIGPADKGLRGTGARWTATSRTLDLLPPKIGRVRPGIDRIYLRINAASTPANVQHFFEIESVDAAQKKLVLAGAVSLLTNGQQYDWRIGTPVRIYEAFFPSQKVGAPDDPQIAQGWLKPSLPEPVVYATIGVSAADKRTEVADVRPGRTPPRPGNEGLLGSPATVFRVYRTEPDTPADGAWDAERLQATRADYHGKSYFTVRWPKPGPAKRQHFKALIFRASRETLFQVDMEQKRTFPLTFSAADDPSPAHWTASRKADVAAKLFAAGSDYAKLLALPTLEAKLEKYRQLSDDALSVLANLPGNGEAFAQVTIDPLDLTPGANDDRRGPDDDATYAARPTMNAWLDEIPGRTQTRYLYKIAYVDSAQNHGPLSKASPPVYVPKVVPPRTPVITKIVGGDRQITLKWAANREPDLAGYRVYRTDDEEKAGDIRLMDKVNDVGAGEVQYDDVVPGLVTFYYRLTAKDSAGNESAPSVSFAGRGYHIQPPDPPIWKTVEWIEENGTPVISLIWTTTDPGLVCVLQRRTANSATWRSLSEEIVSDTTNEWKWKDTTAQEGIAYRYRVRVRDREGNVNAKDNEYFIPSQLVPESK